jgi:hypothetical protein
MKSASKKKIFEIMDNETWGPIHEIGQKKADAQPSTLEAQTVTSKC